MSRSIDWPCASGPSIFPKNSLLPLMSSKYATLTPVFFVKRVERRVLLRLLVDVDVERPVREAQRLRERAVDGVSPSRWLLAPPLIPPPPPQAASRPGTASGGAAGGGPAEQLRRDSWWVIRPPVVDRRRTLRPPRRSARSRSPSRRAAAPVVAVLDVDRDRAGGRLDDVLRRDADVRLLERRRPRGRSPRPPPMRIFSGRMPTPTRPVRPASAAGATRTRGAVVEAHDRVAPRRCRAAGSRRRGSPATNAVAGRSYSSVGAPRCSILPSRS